MRSLRRVIAALVACVPMMWTSCRPDRDPTSQVSLPGGASIVDVRVYIADEFSERERTNIVNGILMWERATNGLIAWRLLSYDPTIPPAKPMGRYEGIEGRTILFRRALSSDEWVQKWNADHAPKKALLGLYQGNSLEELAWLWLIENKLASDDAQAIIAAHEFGHAIGLDHVEDKQSVMSEFYSTETKCLTVHDLTMFCNKHNCDAGLLTSVCRTK